MTESKDREAREFPLHDGFALSEPLEVYRNAKTGQGNRRFSHVGMHIRPQTEAILKMTLESHNDKLVKEHPQGTIPEGTVPIGKSTLGDLLGSAKAKNTALHRELLEAGFDDVRERTNPASHDQPDSKGYGELQCLGALDAFANVLEFIAKRDYRFTNLEDGEITNVVKEIRATLTNLTKQGWLTPGQRHQLREFRRPRKRALLSCGSDWYFVSPDGDQWLRIKRAALRNEVEELGAGVVHQSIGLSSPATLAATVCRDQLTLLRLGIVAGQPAVLERTGTVEVPSDAEILAVEARGRFAALVLLKDKDTDKTFLRCVTSAGGHDVDEPHSWGRSKGGVLVAGRPVLLAYGPGRDQEAQSVAPPTEPRLDGLDDLNEILSIDHAVLRGRQITAAIAVTGEERLQALVLADQRVLHRKQAPLGTYQIDIVRPLDAQRAPVTIALTTVDHVEVLTLEEHR